ncbi:hypothetical protein RND15_49925, partial [Streptomyces sp. DSM 41529]|nr:hypothetical protein [Streptomyces sp. DSM 41529]
AHTDTSSGTDSAGTAAGAGAEIGVIGGSGFYSFLEDVTEVSVDTPYGKPSDSVFLGEIGGRRVAFLPRHGRGHHLPPHRRISYLALLDRCLAPGGHFALTCFAAGEGGMGSELPDAELYRRGDLGGGLAYTSEELRDIFSGLTEVELRRMRDEAPGSPVFGESFL